MARLKVKRVIAGQEDQELEIDESELTENETVEERIEDLAPTVQEAVDKLESDALGAVETLEEDLITLMHSVKNGTLCIGTRTYEIVNHEVSVLVEDFQDCISHGLYQKE